ncbi:cytochrome P450 307a1-like [Macrosteles quadrilineatus]|uniref:cytochrome P450 307a1-like n=1 Tax=Macrosteles quadrilineatus TaxID=74068 RepID=UPI0023E148AA|nr:cytochrome P450 307a1-like [Macrosteles quadrilineatus]XP_054269682.1 cytochrome P450 307a1-like [Macrosteles quadrilineatus]
MEPIFVLSSTTYVLVAVLAAVVVTVIVDYYRSRSVTDVKSDGLKDLPGPRAWPIVGSLHLMGGYEVPYQAFGSLARLYGKVFRLHLGSQPAVVVNGLDNIREVLMAKGTHFDGRPNFRRYHQLFCGDKENSLAFCDWSDLQRTRREMLRAHVFPRAFTSRFHHLDSIISRELNELKARLSSDPTEIKPLLMPACANIFTSYFCSKRFDFDNQDFMRMVRNFDDVFYEVNQGYAADFIPWLMPLHSRHLAQMAQWSHQIREFVVSSVIENRAETWSEGQEQVDYVDSLIDHIKGEQQPEMSWNTALFALEDIIGGHSAVGNFITKILGFIATRPEVQRRIQEEVDSVTMRARDVTLADRPIMPYTEAVIMEVIRLIASPIVPHVATQDSSVAGFRIKKDTLIFLNNYELSMSPDLWSEPEAFQPERFISSDGRLVKPEHFLPFGGGRRSCMGYKMVQLVSFSTLASLLQSFNILPVKGDNYKVPIGNLALPFHTFNFKFEKR